MDLYAYANIDNLEGLMNANGISVPRLRGLRLMSGEPSVTAEEFRDLERSAEQHVCEDVVRACPAWSSNAVAYEFSRKTDLRYNKYVIFHTVPEEFEHNGEKRVIHHKVYDGFRWELLPRRIRKRIKLAVKHRIRRVHAQYEAWNRYAGRPDVLYIHARIGGRNWLDYDGENTVAKQPWFLEKVDDWFDETYCDIYARISVPKEDTL